MWVRIFIVLAIVVIAFLVGVKVGEFKERVLGGNYGWNMRSEYPGYMMQGRRMMDRWGYSADNSVPSSCGYSDGNVPTNGQPLQ